MLVSHQEQCFYRLRESFRALLLEVARVVWFASSIGEQLPRRSMEAPVHISVVHGELGTRQIAYSEVISVEVDTDIAYWNAAFGETSKTLASSNNVPQ